MRLTELRYEVEDGVAVVTLDRPGRLNAFTHRMGAEIVEALDLADADDAVRAVIVTGAGTAFCAGADLGGDGRPSVLHAEPTTGGGDADYGGTVARRCMESTKPLIAAINGPAVGVGATATLPMDVRLCAEEARFGFVFTRVGLPPEACSSWFLPRVVGISRAIEWVSSGRLIGAREAHEAGLVRDVHPAGDLMGAARALAHEMTHGSAPVAVAVARRMLWQMLATPSPVTAHELDSRAILEMRASPDAHEGISAFLERRAPRFRQRVTEDLPRFFGEWRSRTDARVAPGATRGEPPA